MKIKLRLQKTARYFLYAFLTLLLFTACSNEPKMKTVCDCEQKQQVIEWVGDHIKDSNNMADEEMEDVIYRLERTATKSLCSDKLFWCDSHGYIDWEDARNKLDSCETVY